MFSYAWLGKWPLHHAHYHLRSTYAHLVLFSAHSGIPQMFSCLNTDPVRPALDTIQVCLRRVADTDISVTISTKVFVALKMCPLSNLANRQPPSAKRTRHSRDLLEKPTWISFASSSLLSEIPPFKLMFSEERAAVCQPPPPTVSQHTLLLSSDSVCIVFSTHY